MSADSRTPAQRAGQIVRAAEAAPAAARTPGATARPDSPAPGDLADTTGAPPGGLLAAADDLDAQLARARSQLDALEVAVDRLARLDGHCH
ncbi:MAG: hypothetical protein QOG70_3094 [Solirubrobacteraceae bacterium]|nr:hypothetical protein [Solirubrobacteraceae bacterium]